MEGTLAEIRLFAGNFAPRGWAICDGTLQQIAVYDSLFTLLGTTFGGDGVTTFGLPDLRGRVPVHVGTGTGLPTVNLGDVFGLESVTLTSAQIPTHTHNVIIAPGSSKYSISVNDGNSTMYTPAAGASIAQRGLNDTSTPPVFTPLDTYNTNAPSVAIKSNAAMNPTNAPQGGSLPHENMMPFLALNYIICMEGIYPSQQ